MSDMSAPSVRAFLQYLYFGGISVAQGNSTVASQLLKKADQYNIPKLWEPMITILMIRPVEWYSVDDALSLFAFAQERLQQSKERAGDFKELMEKMKQVLVQ